MAANSAQLKAAGFALVLAVVPALLVAAQGDETQYTGALVNVAASGGDIRAAGAAVTVAGTAANIKVAGAEVNVSAEAAGSIWAAGARVTLSGPVAAAVKAIGATIVVSGKIGGDVDLAGGAVDVNSAIGGNLRAGGATVSIGKEATVAGTLSAGGANVVFDGHVTGPVNLGGAVVLFNGTADGPVSIAGAHVVIGSGAHIGGDLTIQSAGNAVITDGATIAGKVSRVQPPEWSTPPWAWRLGLAVAIAIGTVLTGIVLILFGGRIFITATEHARHRPMSSFLIGLLVVLLIPAVAIILMATLVGLSVGFSILLLMPAILVFGHAVAAAGIATGLLVRSVGPLGLGRGVLMLVIGAVIIVAIGFIPWVGGWAVAIVLLLGAGALARTVGAKLRSVMIPVAVAPAA